MEDKEMNPEGVSPETETAQTPEEIAPETRPPEVPADELAAEPPAEEAAEIPESEAGEAAAAPEGAISVEELMASNEGAAVEEPAPVSQGDSQLRAVLEAIIYVADEPLTLAQIAAALQQPADRIREL